MNIHENLAYFCSTYEESHAAFKVSAASVKLMHPGTETGVIPVPSLNHADLVIDYCYIPASGSPKRILVLTSGIHGIEAFAGSAIQRMVLEKMLPGMDLDSTGLLVIHGINPFGFKYLRRVTENNVDLNRNFSVDSGLFAVKNPGYMRLRGFLNPRKKVSMFSPAVVFFPLRAAYIIMKNYRIMRHTRQSLRQAIMQGQYEFPEGIYYGGREFEPQVEAIKSLFVRLTASYRDILFIDLHTGFGRRGKLHFFPGPVKDPEMRKAIEHIFKGNTIDWGDSSDFYITSGDFSECMADLVPAGKRYIPMVFEFGTKDSQTTRGSIRSIQTTILENQAFHHGCASGRDCATVREMFMEMYCPSSPGWRAEVMEQVESAILGALRQFKEF